MSVFSNPSYTIVVRDLSESLRFGYQRTSRHPFIIFSYRCRVSGPNVCSPRHETCGRKSFFCCYRCFSPLRSTHMLCISSYCFLSAFLECVRRRGLAGSTAVGSSASFSIFTEIPVQENCTHSHPS